MARAPGTALSAFPHGSDGLMGSHGYSAPAEQYRSCFKSITGRTELHGYSARAKILVLVEGAWAVHRLRSTRLSVEIPKIGKIRVRTRTTLSQTPSVA